MVVGRGRGVPSSPEPEDYPAPVSNSSGEDCHSNLNRTKATTKLTGGLSCIDRVPRQQTMLSKGKVDGNAALTMVK